MTASMRMGGLVSLILAWSAHAAILESGQVERFEGQLVVGFEGAGFYEINGGSDEVLRSLIVASEPTPSSGEVVVTGAGTTLLLTGTGQTNQLDFHSGVGRVTVSNGASIAVATDRSACDPAWCLTFIGNFAGSDSTLTIADPGSSVTTINRFIVGQSNVFTSASSGFDAGQIGGATVAEVNVLNGALLRTEGTTIATTYSQDGDGTESSFATINVSGAGSTWFNSSPVGGDALVFLGAGPNATGNINVTDGGFVLFASDTVDAPSTFFVGDEVSTGASHILVDGPNSRLVVDNLPASGGGFQGSIIQNGIVSVLNGAELDQINTGLVVGLNAGLGILNVGSGATVRSDFVIAGPDGFAGTGLISLSDGTIDGDVLVGDNGILIGNGTIDGNLIDLGGIVGPGFSPGTLTVTGDLLMTGGGTLQLEIGGTAPGQYDQIVVNGIADLSNSSVVISFIEGFLPSPGDLFDVILAETVLGLGSASFLFEGFGGELSFGLSEAGGLALSVISVAVPEPRVLDLFGLALIVMLFIRRVALATAQPHRSQRQRNECPSSQFW